MDVSSTNFVKSLGYFVEDPDGYIIGLIGTDEFDNTRAWVINRVRFEAYSDAVVGLEYQKIVKPNGIDNFMYDGDPIEIWATNNTYVNSMGTLVEKSEAETLGVLNPGYYYEFDWFYKFIGRNDGNQVLNLFNIFRQKVAIRENLTIV